MKNEKQLGMCKEIKHKGWKPVFTIVSHARVGPLNQWEFGKSIFPQIPQGNGPTLLQLTVLNSRISATKCQSYSFADTLKSMDFHSVITECWLKSSS